MFTKEIYRLNGDDILRIVNNYFRSHGIDVDLETVTIQLNPEGTGIEFFTVEEAEWEGKEKTPEYIKSNPRIQELLKTSLKEMIESVGDKTIEKVAPNDTRGLWTRLYNCLVFLQHNSNIKTVGKLLETPSKDVLERRSYGRKLHHVLLKTLYCLGVENILECPLAQRYSPTQKSVHYENLREEISKL